MKIIVDGCDGTGKTTLINEIQKQLPSYKVIKFSQPKTNDPYKEWIGYYKKGHKNYIGDNVILDRCRLSELIYGKVLNRRTRLKQNQIKEFLELTKDSVYIIANTYIETIQQVFETRGEDYIDIKQAKHINALYKYYLQRFGKNNWRSYNFKIEGKKLELFVKNIIRNYDI